MVKRVLSFFDKLEDWVRINLSHAPIVYSLIGAVGIILVWKGVWEIAEVVPGLWGPGSFVIGTVILLATGLLVSFFIGDNIILSGYKREKKLAERTEEEALKAVSTGQQILQKLERIEEEVHEFRGTREE